MSEQLYLMKNLATGYYRIGLSAAPELATTGEDSEIQLLATGKGGQAFKDLLHRDYASFKVRDDWFEFESPIDLWSLASRFGLELRDVDPPSQIIYLDENYDIHVHRYGGMKVSSTVVERCTESRRVSVPWEMGPSEAFRHLRSEQAGLQLKTGFFDFFSASFRLIKVESYLSAELIEARDREDGTPRCWIYKINSSLPGFDYEVMFVDLEMAEAYWERQKDVVARKMR